MFCFFFFSSRRRHTRCLSDWSSDVCSSDLCLCTGITAAKWRLIPNPNRILVGQSEALKEVDVEASADDEIAAPPAQRVVAVGRKAGEIPGAEPAVSKSGPGRLFFLPIARKNIGTLQVDFTGFTRCDCHARVVEQAHGNARQWKADAALAASPTYGLEM